LSFELLSVRTTLVEIISHDWSQRRHTLVASTTNMASRNGRLGNSTNWKRSKGSKPSTSNSNFRKGLELPATTIERSHVHVDSQESYRNRNESSGCTIETNNIATNSVVTVTSQMLEWMPYTSKSQKPLLRQRQFVACGGSTIISSSPTRNVAGSTTPSIIRTCSNVTQQGRTETKHHCSQQWRKIYRGTSTDTITRTTRNCVHVIQSNFLTEMHAKCPVGYYKVHRSGCDCTKMKQTLSMISSNNNLTTEGGLIVLPDTNIKNIPHIFFLAPNMEQINPHPDIITNPKYRISLENILRTQLFPTKAADLPKIPPYKVSCASCLLQLENNGFVCVASKDFSTIQSVIQLANQRKDEKMARKSTNTCMKNKSSLHGDHAFLLLALPRRSLWNIAKKNATEFETNIVMQIFLSQVKDITYDQPLSRSYLNTVIKIYDDGEASTNTTFHLGPHLHSMLRMTNLSIEGKGEITVEDEEDWWLVMVENKPNLQNRTKKIVWNLDLPGGKRHLGETSLQCAIRETEEETSLVVHETWPRYELKELTNTYYVMNLPAVSSS
jgi:hypothetical protein